MGTPGPSPSVRLEDVLQVFESRADSSEPLTASEVAEALDCTRRTALKKLDSLAERGDLESKKTGARSRVWWRTQSAIKGTETSLQNPQIAQFEEFADQVSEYAIFVLDEAGHVETWNAGAETIKGYSEDEIIGKHLSTFYTPADREQNVPQRNLRAAIELGAVADAGWRIREDGSRFWANITITTITDEDGEFSGFIKVTRDMTERHNRQLQLQREKERFESLVTEVKDYAIFMLHPDGTVASWNAGAENIKGYSEDEIVGTHFSTFYTDEDRAAGVPGHNIETAAAAGRTEDEGWRVREDGSRFWANVVITRLTNDDGTIRGFAKITRDMTERRQYEQRLKQQRDELDDLNRINAVIREVDQALVTAASREELDDQVCTRLVGSDPYTAAWIGTILHEQETVRTNAVAGFDPHRLESAHDTTDSAAPIEYQIGSEVLEQGTFRVVEYDSTDQRFDHWPEAASKERPEAVVAIPLTMGSFTYGVLFVYSTDERVFDDRKLDVLSQLGKTISDTLASLRRKKRERRLTALHHATRDLVNTEDASDLGETIASTITDILGFRSAHLYRFNTDDNTLQPLASVSRDGNTPVQLTVLSAKDDSDIWSAFVDGSTKSYDATTSHHSDHGDERALRTHPELIVPLSEHGVLVVEAEPDQGIDADDRQLVDLVAATAESAFDRLESEANLRERDSILQEQNQRLQRLNQVNTVIREVDQALVQAATYEEIQRVVCECLTRTDRFRFSWIGETQGDDGTLEPAASAGPDSAYLDEISLDAGSDEPTAVAARTGTVQMVENVADDLRAAPWRSEAFSRELQSCIAVPLTYGDITYGVLSVYADQPDTFGGIEESVFDELGTTIGNAIHAVETKHALMSDRTVEVEFSLTGGDSTILTALARETDTNLSYEGTIPVSDDAVRVFFSASTEHADTIVDTAAGIPNVIGATMVTERDDGILFELELTGDSLAAALATKRTVLTEFTVKPSGASVRIDVPASADVGDFIDWFLDTYTDATFVTRRERDRQLDNLGQPRAAVTEQLTDRQFEVLKTAYLSGFFDTPRQSTGRDVADTIGVSQPTVTEHLRAAQRRILETVLEK